MPVSFEFLRGALGVIGLGCAFMTGRAAAAARKGWMKPARLTPWLVRDAVCLGALAIRHDVDAVAVLVWSLAAAGLRRRVPGHRPAQAAGRSDAPDLSRRKVTAAAGVRVVTIFSYMSLVVVGSVAYDGVETPHGKVDRMLGGAATYISLAASYFTSVKLVAVVGDDFAGRRRRPAGLAQHRSGGPGARRRRQDVLLGGRLLGRHERPHHAAHRPQRLRRFQPQAARGLPLRALPAAGQHPAGAAAERARADERAEAGRRRHHELLDQGFPRRAAGHHPRVGFPADQRHRSPPAFGRAATCARRRPKSSTWGRTRW